MSRVAIALLVGASLGALAGVRDPFSRDDRRYWRIYQNAATAAVGGVAYHFCDALAQGDRVGTWGCVNGDGTATPGDNLGPWVAGGSPVKYGGTTCSAPSYSTLNGATPDYFISTSAIGAVPAAFTICGVYSLTSSTVFSAFAWQTGLGGAYTITTEQSATLVMYPNGLATFNSLSTLGTNDKSLICYSNSGGSDHIYIRTVAGSINGYLTRSAGSPTLGAGAQKILFGADSASYGATGKFFGGFYTEKELSQSDLDTIYAAVIGSGCT